MKHPIAMQIIPVIDLKDGVVVHARQGMRESYQPIHSELCRSPDIFAVIEAYLTLYDFTTFYLADLNALEHGGQQDALIDEAAKHFPKKTFWLDQGFRMPNAYHSDNVKTVLGSESVQENTVEMIASYRKDFILSLDHSATGRLGAKCLFTNSDYWPNDVIIMTLQRVGSHSGPDLKILEEFRRNHPEKNFIAAGGIRNKADLLALKEIGVNQVLVASALHSGSIGRAILSKL